MNKKFILLLCNLVLIQSGAVYAENSAPAATSPYWARLKQCGNGLLTLGSAAGSAAAGLFVGAATLSFDAYLSAQRALHLEKANELLRPLLDTLSQENPTLAEKYPMGFKEWAASLLPKSHPYWQELDSAQGGDDDALVYLLGFCCSAALLTIAYKITYNYFYPNQKNSSEVVAPKKLFTTCNYAGQQYEIYIG